MPVSLRGVSGDLIPSSSNGTQIISNLDLQIKGEKVWVQRIESLSLEMRKKDLTKSVGSTDRKRDSVWLCTSMTLMRSYLLTVGISSSTPMT